MRIWADLITVAETPTFMQQAESIWSDEEREGFVDFIARNPNAGDVIPQIRKVKWGRQGRGKRGGTRVIYFFHDRGAPIYLLMIYTKTGRENISPEAKKVVREFAARIKQAPRSREARGRE